MSVMKAVKNVLEWVAIVALIVFIFSPPQARADGMHGVTVTAKEILVEVPKFCRPVKFIWEAIYERNESNKDAVMSFIQSNDDKFKTLSFQEGRYRFQTTWYGGTTIRIPRFDATGKPINIKRLSIAGMGDELGDFSQDNWIFILDRGIPKNISPPVRVGTWGKCK